MAIFDKVNYWNWTTTTYGWCWVRHCWAHSSNERPGLLSSERYTGTPWARTSACETHSDWASCVLAPVNLKEERYTRNHWVCIHQVSLKVEWQEYIKTKHQLLRRNVNTLIGCPFYSSLQFWLHNFIILFLQYFKHSYNKLHTRNGSFSK